MKQFLLKIPILGNFLSWLNNLVKLSGKLAKVQKNTEDIQKTIQFSVQNKKLLDELSIDFRATKAEIQSEVTRMNAPFPLQDFYKVDKPIINEDIKNKIGEHGNYVLFEEVFRGSSDSIKKNQNFYLSYIKKASASTDNGNYFLDIACGGGELLELIREQKINCKGIDLNRSLVSTYEEKRLDVEIEDANKYLDKVLDNSLIGISAIHFIEHNSSNYLNTFLKLCYEKIAKGGVLLIESVNPYCYLSLGHFYLDITHCRPYSAETIKFFLEVLGFKETEIIYKAPCPPEFRVKNFLDHNYQEYAVIGWKE